ncbi:MAG TPA: malto-oligosyltrehalose trehalohydrolase [Polyangia bacterium]|nr:malto-oligosyltrehalose trehalohydrolase [Polyangia bacterium]
MRARRRMWGAEPDERGVHFRVLAPGRERVEVIIGEGPAARAIPLARDDEPGTWTGVVPDLRAGALYRYRLAPDEEALADPASRFQPAGVLGPSEVIDPRFAWTDARFPGIPAKGRVVYELHVGTFTAEGTWDAARAHLPDLARLGVTVVEVMPVGEFPGKRGWGYDGVFWFAPFHGYGRPDDMRRFVDDAHRLGIGVILDVVYNHLGDVGNVLPRFSRDTVGSKPSEWGTALNFDEGAARPMRAFVVENAVYWIDELHLDGFRFDATQTIVDSSTPHVLAEATAAARAAAGDKTLYLVAENEPQDSRLVRSTSAGGVGLDALWNDDFHHAAHVALTGHGEAYFMDYTGLARELAACVRHGFLFQGQRYAWQDKPRGLPTRGLAARAFVIFLENHDQLANEGLGERLWTRVAPGRLRALTALTLLAPSTPLLFQGQEWNATARFAYFADQGPDLAGVVKAGRAEFLRQFPRYASPEARDRFPDPGAPETFASCSLDWNEREAPLHARAFRLHRDLLELRREDPTFAREGLDGVTVDAAALTDALLVVRYLGADPGGADDRLLLVNLGVDFEPRSSSEPLVAPPPGHDWQLTWSSDDPRYGGAGARGPQPGRALFFPGEAAVVMSPTALPAREPEPKQPKPNVGEP